MIGTAPSVPHIMLVDDHPIVRRGVRGILADAFPGASIEEVSFAAEAIRRFLGGPRWDVVILDITLPDGSGMDVLGRIRELDAQLPVLILSMHSADQFARRALGAGASGYLTKDVADRELIVAVTSVVAGQTYVSAPPQSSALGAPCEQVVPRRERLSVREREVLTRLAYGKTVRDIATELRVSTKTVSTYRARLLRKLSMRTNAEITRYALENGLMDATSPRVVPFAPRRATTAGAPPKPRRRTPPNG